MGEVYLPRRTDFSEDLGVNFTYAKENDVKNIPDTRLSSSS
jgi:hypothetical protein